MDSAAAPFLTVVMPCFNEEKTLEASAGRVLRLGEGGIRLELIVVDDGSTDGSLAVAENLAARHPAVRVLRHEKNRGKGAALRTGFRAASGDFVAVQDADLEYDPRDLPGLLAPLRDGRADAVYGSRFAGNGRRVLWHSLGNAFLTFLSNLFTDLNLTDMETCYKVFRREVIQGIEIEEDRFGFEPEITAKLAHRKYRICEMGISYNGRSYAEGKKIGWRDGLRALYCIFLYNREHLPLAVQFGVYVFIGGAAALVNLGAFLLCLAGGLGMGASVLAAFLVAATVNYLLCVALLFRHKARWNSFTELLVYSLVVAAACGLDVGVTLSLSGMGTSPWLAKSLSSLVGLLFNYAGRRWLVFPLRTKQTLT